MNWSCNKPVKPGWYWWRESNNARGIIVQVDILTGTVSSSGTDEYRLLKEIIGGQWCGPLKEPQ